MYELILLLTTSVILAKSLLLSLLNFTIHSEEPNFIIRNEPDPINQNHLHLRYKFWGIQMNLLK